jgi:hypothetical protein
MKSRIQYWQFTGILSMFPLKITSIRINNMFPSMEDSLIIPTQHNQLMTYNGYSGVEVDCYAREFNRKLQLLLHFSEEKVRDASVLESMLYHTFKYRQSQLNDFIETVINPAFSDKFDAAAHSVGAENDLIDFVKAYTVKLKTLLDKNYDQTPSIMVKNKLLTNYFKMLHEFYDIGLINRAQTLLKEVKKVVKRDFALDYFYDAQEIIEEVRSLGGCVIVPTSGTVLACTPC